MAASFAAAATAELPGIAARLLEHFALSAADRNAIEELLWADDAGPGIPKRFRRELGRSLGPGDLFLHEDGFFQLLDRLWVLGDSPMSAFSSFFGGVPDDSLRTEIQRHVVQNPGDWSTDQLFETLGAYECTSRRFALFLEGLASADVRPDETEQRRFVQLVNESMRPCSVELQELAEEDGYPVFTLVSLSRGNLGRPKNLIFASSVKPDLRFRDAVNNDIEIVTNADQVLVYDRPIGAGGLRWRELQTWWAESHGIASEAEAKATLYRRLLASLPTESPPQRLFFTAFFESLRASVPAFPALLPEVWLHWDPKTVKERGPDALARFRMDFLLLLPANVRVVVEVDGKSHYADADGTANATKYAAMMAADRDQRLAGYEIYRFGATELDGAAGTERVKKFVEALFKSHGVTAES